MVITVNVESLVTVARVDVMPVAGIRPHVQEQNAIRYRAQFDMARVGTQEEIEYRDGIVVRKDRDRDGGKDERNAEIDFEMESDLAFQLDGEE